MCWCSYGSLLVTFKGCRSFASEIAAGKLLRKHMDDNIINFNDSHTHEEVLAAWDEAIAEAEAQKL